LSLDKFRGRRDAGSGPPSLTLDNWKDFLGKYGVFTDSLWLMSTRDNTGGHNTLYHGGFIPQIPRQGILRFTKPYDLIIDAFLGYGTSLIECRRWGRHGIGVELNQNVAELAAVRVEKEPNRFDVKTLIFRGDSTSKDFASLVTKAGFKTADLVLLHPPYYDIIKYDEDKRNLCNASNVESFLRKYRNVLRKSTLPLKNSGYLEVVVGDKYEKGGWIPLGFQVMQTTINEGFKLKSICIKNIEETSAKRHMINLWKYRTIRSGSYFFKHEYIFFFQKHCNYPSSE
jgi:hypothetical protein